MMGFVLGTACLIGLVKMARHGGGCGHGYGHRGCGGRGCGHDGWGHGGWGHGRWHGHGHDHGDHGEHRDGYGEGRGWGFERVVLRRIFERLDTTPGQEKVIVQAVSEGRDAIRSAVGEFRGSRDDLAKVIAGESFDETALGGVFAKQDEALANARKALTGALAKVHEALDSRQRSALADMIARGPRNWGRFGGPYRM